MENLGQFVIKNYKIYISSIALVILLGCSNKKKSVEYTPNTSLEIVSNIEPQYFFRPNTGDSILYSIIKASDLSIIYNEWGQLSKKSDRIFTISDSSAEMIWIHKDSVRSTRAKGDSIESYYADVVNKKSISILEACEFIDKLQYEGAFTLAEEKELLKICHPSDAWDHPSSYTLKIYKEGKLRRVTYTDIKRRIENCPDVSDWQRMANIKNLFERQWEE